MTEKEYFAGDELAASTWRNKYAKKDDKTPWDMHLRLAKAFYEKESYYDAHLNGRPVSDYGKTRKSLSEDMIFALFHRFKFVIPGGSVMAGIGSEKPVSLSNCFVLGSPKDSYSDIMKTRSFQIQLMKRRGGAGKDLSELRPRGAAVNNSARTSTGAASFMDVDSAITNEVAQNGRRGALMLTMSINHPDVEEFITKKQDLTKVTGANISVKVTDEFMQAVEKDEDYFLRYPVTISDKVLVHYDIENYEYGKLEEINLGYVKRVKAKELWNILIHCAWNTAEPGIMFESKMHDFAPDGVYPEFRGVSSNPCGEIFMGPFDSCRLIHVNLTSFVDNPYTSNAILNLDLVYKVFYEATRLADDLVDLEMDAVQKIIDKVKDEENKEEFNLWSKIKDTAQKGRRAGLGFTGLADMLAMMGVPYGTEDSLEVVHGLMHAIMKAQLDSQIDMAIERGTFPGWKQELEMKPLISCGGAQLIGENDWYNFIIDNFEEQAKLMFQHGRRNLSWSTVAPTGTVSLMAMCSSGIEPVFRAVYQRKRKCMSPEDRVDYVDSVGEKYTLFTVVHPGLQNWAMLNNSWNEKPINDWNYDDWMNAYERSPYYQATSHDISWSNRVKLQGLIQAYITHSISSTVNLANTVSEDEVSTLYMEAWKNKLKGITIYRDGSREGVLTETKPESIDTRQAPKRPKELEADVYIVKASGKQYVVIVGLLEGKPYEIFAFSPANPVKFPTHKGIITKVKKMHYSFKSEHMTVDNLRTANANIEETAATLYSSMLLRHGVPIRHIIKTAKKVNDNIVSFSSAMCRVLANYDKSEVPSSEKCPNCGAPLVREGGCLHCSSCEWSRCD